MFRTLRRLKRVGQVAFLLALTLLSVNFSGVCEYISALSYDKYYEHPHSSPDLFQDKDFEHFSKLYAENCTPGIFDHSLNDFLVIIVKSSIGNFERRAAIRKSWGKEESVFGLKIVTRFLVGTRENELEIETLLRSEYNAHHDIIQGNFLDTYKNLTQKTLMGFEWSLRHCPDADYYLFVDDDHYVSVKNVQRFIENPTTYPSTSTKSQRDNLLYAGKVFPCSLPKRHWLSKHYVSLQAYPYDRYPPYVTAGAYVLSREALRALYNATRYTGWFPFDDVYLGMAAKAAGIPLLHNDHFLFSRPWLLRWGQGGLNFLGWDAANAITVHGFDNPHEMVEFWRRQRSEGNA